MSSAAEVARHRAEAALALRRWDDALREATLAVGADPEALSGHTLLARALLGKDDGGGALAAADAGLARHPDDDQLFRLRGLALRRQKRFREALAAADEALRLQPGLAVGHYLRSLVLQDLERLDEARAAAEQAVALDPEDAILRTHLGDLALATSPAAAEQHYRASLAVNPGSAHTLNNLGVALTRQGRGADAALAFKAAVLVDPTLTIARENTHATVAELLGGGVLVAGLAAVQGFRILSFDLGERTLTGIALAVVFGLAYAAGLRWYRRWKLGRRDPELLALWEKLDAARRRGSL